MLPKVSAIPKKPSKSFVITEGFMKKLDVFASLCFGLAGVSSAFAQEFDPALGLSGFTAPSAFDATGNYSPQDIGGGVYPNFSGDFIFTSKSRLGINANVAWRGGQNNYSPASAFGGTLPFRPILYTFNALYAPRLNDRVTLEMYGGLGGESIRFYQPNYTCNFNCTNYTSSNHFLGDVGGGIRFYVTKRLFVRPEAQVYFIRNNFEFSGPRATRAGVSIGYTFGGFFHY